MDKFSKRLDLILIDEAIRSPRLFWRAVKAIKKELAKYPPEKHDVITDFIINKMLSIFPTEDREFVRTSLKKAISLGLPKHAIHQTISTSKV